MYYFLSPKLVYWKGDIVSAELVSEPPRSYELNWWYGSSLNNDLHEFVFSVIDKAPVLDNYWTGNVFSLYSNRLVNILRRFDIKFETFPSRIVSRETGSILLLNYQVFRLTDISEVLNEKKSKFKTLSIGGRKTKLLDSPSFTEKFLRSKIMLTRISGYEKHIVVHENLKKIIEDERITGCDFVERRLNESSIFHRS